MSQTVIKVESLSKRFTLGTTKKNHNTLYDMLGDTLRKPWRSKISEDEYQSKGNNSFLALQDLSFNIQSGEVLGVIGRNGAGKSTLLKILSRITAPTKGTVLVRGRLASLLEVGTGFHGELSGRENIFLNGAILGMKRTEVLRKFDEIVAFAGVEQFIDTAVKRYSSGMYVRLAFAVAAHLEADVLVVDEVLAVGDLAFQRKSMGKMQDVARNGRTVIFVSHNLAAMRNLCTRGIVLDQGVLNYDGPMREALSVYEGSLRSKVIESLETSFSGPMNNKIAFKSLRRIQDDRQVESIDPLKPFRIELAGESSQYFEYLEIKVAIKRDGVHVTSLIDSAEKSIMTSGKFVSTFDFPADALRPGSYTVGIGASAPSGEWLWGEDVSFLDFIENRGSRSLSFSDGIVSIPCKVQRLQ